MRIADGKPLREIIADYGRRPGSLDAGTGRSACATRIKKGGCWNGAAPWSVDQRKSRLLIYSLKTKTRFCPEKRTSVTWPFSLKRTAS